MIRLPGALPGGAGFAGIVSALFDRLGLGEGEAPGELRPPQYMVVGDFEIEFADTEDETGLLCSCIAGRLADERRQRHEQLTAILRRNLAGLTRYLICVSLDREGEGGPALLLQFSLPYKGLTMPDLLDRVEDLAALAADYGALLALPSAGRGKEPPMEDSLIFTP